MFRDFFAALFSGFCRAILGMFGMSPEERLGKAETIAQTQANTIEEVQNAQHLATKYDHLSDSALRVRTGQWKRQ